MIKALFSVKGGNDHSIEGNPVKCICNCFFPFVIDAFHAWGQLIYREQLYFVSKREWINVQPKSTAVDILNPGQGPIITVDQPLFTIAKQIQWNWTASHGEDQFIAH